MALPEARLTTDPDVIGAIALVISPLAFLPSIARLGVER
jgi:hypothetical protein